MAAKIYITGATGRLGSAVLQRIDAIPLVRKPSGLRNEIVTDFSDLKILKDAKTIIHIAGSVNTLEKKDLWDANVELTRKIVDAAPDEAKIIFAGSISVYGIKIRNSADENTPPNPYTYYGKSKYMAEEIVRSHKNHVILRIGTIYGPQFEIFFHVIRAIENGKMKVIGDGNNRIPFVHVDDVAKVFVNALKKGKGTYVVAGDPLTQNQIMEIACKELGVKKPKHIAFGVAMFLAGLGELRYRLTGKKPAITKQAIAVLGADRCFDCSKAKKELGFSPRPLDNGIAAMIMEYRKRKKG